MVNKEQRQELACTAQDALLSKVYVPAWVFTPPSVFAYWMRGSIALRY